MDCGREEQCEACNNTHEDAGHRVGFQFGVMVSAVYLKRGPHQYELRLVPKCGLCAGELRMREQMRDIGSQNRNGNNGNGDGKGQGTAGRRSRGSG